MGRERPEALGVSRYLKIRSLALLTTKQAAEEESGHINGPRQRPECDSTAV